VRAINPQIRCLIEGGPIVTPEQMDQVCRFAHADGYIGGSTIDRVPLESAVEMATGAFKTIGALRKQVDSLEKKLHRKTPPQALIGFSESIDRAREQVAQAMETDLPVLIVGEPGTGRHEIASLIHEARVGKRRWLTSAECKADAGDNMELALFGCVAGAFPGVEETRTGLLDVARGSSLVLDDVAMLDIAVQRQLLQALRDGGFWPRGGAQIVPLQVRFIGISRFDPAGAADAKRFDANFLQWLGALRIELPPLRERLEDLPMLTEAVLRDISRGEKIKLDPSAYRVLLSHPWVGNLTELRSILETAARASRLGIITEHDLAHLLKPGQQALSEKKSFASEREWILDALKRNRFRRAETARFLRLSRKTLYNKMQQHGLPSEAEPSKKGAVRRRR
jgi:DNA-binding NtrC family response regulator